MISQKIKDRVYKEVKKIPKGKTKTYKEIAQKAKIHPRVVGIILKQNFDPNMPCHRVIMSSGKLGGYNRGIRKKKEFLRKEKKQN